MEEQVLPGIINHFLQSGKRMIITNSDNNINRKTDNREHANFHRSPKKKWLNKHSPGFTLIELLVVVTIIGILASIAIIGYVGYVEKAKVVTAVNEINMLEKAIYAYGVAEATPLPPDQTTKGYGGFLDPWQRPYVYNPPPSPPQSPLPDQRCNSIEY